MFFLILEFDIHNSHFDTPEIQNQFWRRCTREVESLSIHSKSYFWTHFPGIHTSSASGLKQTPSVSIWRTSWRCKDTSLGNIVNFIFWIIHWLAGSQTMMDSWLGDMKAVCWPSVCWVDTRQICSGYMRLRWTTGGWDLHLQVWPENCHQDMQWFSCG